MTEFEILIRRSEGAGNQDAPHGISMRANNVTFTRLLRQNADAPDDFLEASPAQLAFWLVDNWWRLRWECIPPKGITSQWRLAHDLSSMGSFAWPRLVLWGEGERIGIASRSDPAGIVGPVRYLTDALQFVKSEAFEFEVDRFLEIASDEMQGFGSDRSALRAQVGALMTERADVETAEWRKLEARLGYDPDHAPEHLMETLGGLSNTYGVDAVGEAAMAVPGTEAANVLEEELASAQQFHWQCDLSRTAKMAGLDRAKLKGPPWFVAERVAQALRKAAGLTGGPISNNTLSDLLNVRSRALKTDKTMTKRERAYGLRLNTGRSRGEVVALSSKWSMDRRFEFSRALGDAIWSASDILGPITRAKTERQKFQRAFAQSLLCPYEELLAYVNTETPSDGAMAAAAKHFHVSETLVRTVLVNKGILDRGKIKFIRVDDSSQNFDELVEAA